MDTLCEERATDPVHITFICMRNTVSALWPLTDDCIRTGHRRSICNRITVMSQQNSQAGYGGKELTLTQTFVLMLAGVNLLQAAVTLYFFTTGFCVVLF